MAKTVDEIMDEYNRRRQENIGRNRDFWYLHGIYHGFYFDSRARDIMDGQGRVLLRDNRREDRQQPLVANLLKAIVDDYVSLTGIVPDIKVPAPGVDQGSQEFADMMEKYHYGVWHASNMVIQLKSMAWWESDMGGCCAIVWPNYQKKHAEIRFVGPDKVYGVPDLIDPYSFSSAIVVEQYQAKTIQDYFPGKKVQEWMRNAEQTRSAAWPSSANMIEIIRYFDKNSVTTVMTREVTTIRGKPHPDGKREAVVEMGRVSHDIGRCLVEPFQNLLVPGETRGVSDIEEQVGLNQYINFLMNSHEEYIKQEIFAPIIVIDPQKVPEDIDLESPTAVIAVNAGGDVKRLQTSATGQQVVASEVQRTQGLIEYVAGTPQVRTEGRLKSSISTGRAMEKAQGPHFGRVEYRNDLNAFRLERVNEMSVMLTMSEFRDEKIELFGSHQRGGGMFRVTIMGKDLEGYTFNKVLYTPSMHMGLEQRVVTVLQLRQAKPRPLVSQRTGIEILGLTDHPDEEIELIEREMEREAVFQSRLAKIAQGGQGGPGGDGGGGSDPMGVTNDKVALESGSTKALGGGAAGLAAPPAPPGGGVSTAPTALGSTASKPPMDIGGAASIPLQPEQPAPQSGLEKPTDLADRIRQVVSAIEGLKGDVYLVSKDAEEIKLLTENYLDARRVSRRLRPIWGDKVSVRESKKIPKDAVKVSGGA